MQEKEPKTAKEALGLSCKIWRTLQGIPAKEIAAPLGYCPQNLYHFEAGDACSINLLLGYIKKGFDIRKDLVIDYAPVKFGTLEQFCEKWC